MEKSSKHSLTKLSNLTSPVMRKIGGTFWEALRQLPPTRCSYLKYTNQIYSWRYLSKKKKESRLQGLLQNKYLEIPKSRTHKTLTRCVLDGKRPKTQLSVTHDIGRILDTTTHSKLLIFFFLLQKTLGRQLVKFD